MGGVVAHSVLLRKNQHMMNARQFRDAIDTLVGSKSIEEIRKAPAVHEYRLLKEEEK